MTALGFYRYVTGEEALLISEMRTIAPSPDTRVKYYKPDRYETGDEAQRRLSMAYKPTHRVGPIPAGDMPEFDHVSLQRVAPRRVDSLDLPGGGL